MNRTFLGKELDDVAVHCNDDIQGIDDFVKEHQGALAAWAKNMKNLKYQDKRYPEQHMECFLAWAEFNTKDE